MPYEVASSRRVRIAVVQMTCVEAKAPNVEKAVDRIAAAAALGANIVGKNMLGWQAAALNIAERTEVVFGDAFRWTVDFRRSGSEPLTVFCCPPYDFYVERRAEMLDLISCWVERCSPGSQVVVEADERFDFVALTHLGKWDVRTYPPATVAIFECAE